MIDIPVKRNTAPPFINNSTIGSYITSRLMHKKDNNGKMDNNNELKSTTTAHFLTENKGFFSFKSFKRATRAMKYTKTLAIITL